MDFIKPLLLAFFALAACSKETTTIRFPNILGKKQTASTQIGIIKINDQINHTTAETFLHKITQFSRDAQIKGIILMLSCPGGSSGASELLFREMKRLAGKKPIVALVTNNCHSGGYLIAAAAHWIIAPELASVGSIGTFCAIEKHTNPRLENANGYSANIEYEFFQGGKFKVTHFCNTAPLTAEDRALIQAEIDADYKTFYTIVAKEKSLSLDNLSDWADGKAFPGGQALALGLIDQIGGYSDAVDKLVELMEKQAPVEAMLTFIE